MPRQSPKDQKGADLLLADRKHVSHIAHKLDLDPETKCKSSTVHESGFVAFGAQGLRSIQKTAKSRTGNQFFNVFFAAILPSSLS